MASVRRSSSATRRSSMRSSRGSGSRTLSTRSGSRATSSRTHSRSQRYTLSIVTEGSNEVDARDDPCVCGPNFYQKVFGPTADESILVGLQTVIGLCEECPPREDSENISYFTTRSSDDDLEYPAIKSTQTFLSQNGEDEVIEKLDEEDEEMEMEDDEEHERASQTIVSERRSNLSQTEGLTGNGASQTEYVLTHAASQTRTPNLKSASSQVKYHRTSSSQNVKPHLKSSDSQTKDCVCSKRSVVTCCHCPVESKSVQYSRQHSSTGTTRATSGKTLSDSCCCCVGSESEASCCCCCPDPPSEPKTRSSRKKASSICSCCQNVLEAATDTSKKYGSSTICSCYQNTLETATDTSKKCTCSSNAEKQISVCCDCTSNSSGMEDDETETCMQMGDNNEGTVRYAITKITKFYSYTTFEVMKSTSKKPKVMPKSLEGVFVLRNCKD